MISVADGLRCYYNNSTKEKTPLELEKENRILKSNWNSLREWINIRLQAEIIRTGMRNEELIVVLDKMNELEGVDNENN